MIWIWALISVVKTYDPSEADTSKVDITKTSYNY